MPARARSQALVGARDEARADRDGARVAPVAARPVGVLAEEADPAGHEELDVVLMPLTAHRRCAIVLSLLRHAIVQVI